MYIIDLYRSSASGTTRYSEIPVDTNDIDFVIQQADYWRKKEKECAAYHIRKSEAPTLFRRQNSLRMSRSAFYKGKSSPNFVRDDLDPDDNDTEDS